MKIDCNVLKNRYENELKKYHEHYITANIPDPKLLIVGCGLSEESMIYVRNKIKKCSKFGIEVELIDTKDFQQVCEVIGNANKNDDISSIILQLPCLNLSKELQDKALDLIDEDKDVDKLSKANRLKWLSLFQDDSAFCLPITSQVIVDILNYCVCTSDQTKKFISKPNTSSSLIDELFKLLSLELSDLTGYKIALYGRGNLTNKPLINFLINKNATVTVFHSKSPQDYILDSKYDIHIVSVGKPRLYKIDDNGHGNGKPRLYKIDDNGYGKKIIIIDVGVNRDENGKVCGDVDTRGFENNPNILYTPVPKGIGMLVVDKLCLQVYINDYVNKLIDKI